MNNDTTIAAWKKRLEKCAVTLENHPEVPEWLRKTVRDAISVADQLNPRSEPEQNVDNYHYPH